MRQPVPFGKYLLLDRISVGGMAEVFKAKSYGVEGFEKVIAIKRILPSMGEDKDFIKMFIDEAKIAGQLSHANICQIFELGKHQGAHFIAMEYIWGKDLLQIQNRLRKVGQIMPVAMACYVIAKVCEGLDYAHRKRDPMGRALEIVHRDCSPQNVLISYEGEVKLIDFGIARAASRSSRTNAGVLKGKFGYMSPEQVRGLPLDHRSDLFAIGTVFYECLTGERLFQGESDFSTLEKVRNADVRPPSELNNNVPPEVEGMVMRALARDVKTRYQTGGEMHADLQAFLTKQDVPFTNKTMADWLRAAFRDEVDRERQLMEEYKKVGRDGLIAGVPQAKAKVDVLSTLGDVPPLDGDPTTLGGPDIEALDAMGGPTPLRSPAARGKVVRSGEREDYEDEGPTEIFGEISHDPPEMPPDAYPVDDSTPLPRPMAGGLATTTGIHPSEVLGQSDPMIATPSGVGVPAYVQNASSGQMMPQPYYPQQPRADGGPPYSPYPPPATPLPTQAPARRGWRRRRNASVGRDVAIGCAIAALVLAAFISAKFLMFGDEPKAQAQTGAKGTIAVMADGSEPSEVTVDGAAVGVLKGDAPLTLGGIEPGDRLVRVTRGGAPPCEKRVDVRADKIEVVRCSFGQKQATGGSLLLTGVIDDHRVYVDDQEITAESAREPIQLTPGVEHTIVIKTGSKVVDQFAVNLQPGQEMQRQVALKTAGVKPSKTAEVSPAVDDEDGDKVPTKTAGKTVESEERTNTSPTPPSGSSSGDEELKPRKKETGSSSSGSSGSSAKLGDGSSAADQGLFTAYTKPWARVFIDGKDTGKMTPIAPRSAIALSPGNHKVVFVVGDQKFPFTVTIRPGEKKNLVKVLPVKE
jgi:serine/threonine protein kinase